MTDLKDIVNRLDNELSINSFGKDASFSRFIPHVYDPIHFDWKSTFEKEFVELFNGLMVKGESKVGTIFLAVFPTDHVLEGFIEEGKAGDLLFMHHPLFMECGDPKGKWGQGFLPIKEEYIRKILGSMCRKLQCHL